MEQKRLNFIDYGRFLCILCVCIAHSGTHLLHRIGAAVLLMPFFFFIFGYLSKPEKYSFGEFVLTRFRQIVILFFLIQPFCFALYLLRVKIFNLDVSASSLVTSYFLYSLYGSDIFPPFAFFKSFSLPQFQETASSILTSFLNAPTWFLPVMFSASLIFYPLAKLLEKKLSAARLSAVIVCLFCLAGIETQIPYAFQLPWGLGRAFLAAGIMLAGFFVRKTSALENTGKTRACLIYAAALLLVFVARLTGVTGEMVCSDYMSEAGKIGAFMLGIGGSAASFALLLLLKRMDEKYGATKFSRLLALCGRKTRWIYILHLPLFFFFDVLFLKCGIQPQPFNYGHNLYPYNATTLLPHMIQIACTVLLCVLAGCAWEKSKNSTADASAKR